MMGGDQQFDLDDEAQIMRLITLGLAVHWTAHQPADAAEMTFADVFAIAENFARYIESGITGMEGH